MSADRRNKRKKKSGTYELVISLVEAVIIALVIRTLLFQPFSIPSGSMEATLLIGDYLFVTKYTYGYSRYSIPFAPNIFSGRIFGSVPERGDVIVFRHKDLRHNEDLDFIKRLIGLPGDRIEVKEGQLYINGTAVKREPIDDFVGEDPCHGGPVVSFSGYLPAVHVKRWRETLPNGRTYDTLECKPRPVGPDEIDPNNTKEPYVVPPGKYFFMGDNRNNSEDSRFPDVSYVADDLLIGKARILFFSLEGGEPAWHIWNWPWAIRWSRLFTVIH